MLSRGSTVASLLHALWDPRPKEGFWSLAVFSHWCLKWVRIGYSLQNVDNSGVSYQYRSSLLHTGSQNMSFWYNKRELLVFLGHFLRVRFCSKLSIRHRLWFVGAKRNPFL